MLDTATSRRIAAAMERLHEVGERSKARMRLQQPVVDTRIEPDEFGLLVQRPVYPAEAEAEHAETEARFEEAIRRLTRPPVVADDDDDAEPVDEPVVVPVAVVATSAPVVKCKLVPAEPEIGAELSCE